MTAIIRDIKDLTGNYNTPTSFVKEYWQTDALSSHKLMTFYEAPSKYHREYILGEKDERFKIQGADIAGSVIDCLLTTPDDFADRFDIMDVATVGGKTGDLILFLSADDRALAEFSDTELEAAAENADIQKGLKWVKSQLETPKVIAFFTQLQEKRKSNKTIVSSELLAKCKEAQIRLLSDEKVGRYFRNDMLSHEVFYQVPVKFSYGGVACKSLYDMLLVNRLTNDYSIKDLKTTSTPIDDYNKTILLHKTFIQIGFYCLPHYTKVGVDALDPHFNGNFLEPWGKWEDEFSLVVGDSSGRAAPAEYIITEPEIEKLLKGGTFKNGEKFPGVIQLIDDFKWHVDNNLWEHKREYYEKSGYLINLFN